MVPRLSTGLALASDECVWNGDVGRGENGELGPLLTTVESDRRRRIVLLLLLSAVVIEDLRAASWRWCAWVELLVAGARSGSAFFHRGSDSLTSLISTAISTCVAINQSEKYCVDLRETASRRWRKRSRRREAIRWSPRPVGPTASSSQA